MTPPLPQGFRALSLEEETGGRLIINDGPEHTAAASFAPASVPSVLWSTQVAADSRVDGVVLGAGGGLQLSFVQVHHLAESLADSHQLSAADLVIDDGEPLADAVMQSDCEGWSVHGEATSTLTLLATDAQVPHAGLAQLVLRYAPSSDRSTLILASGVSATAPAQNALTQVVESVLAQMEATLGAGVSR